MLHRRIVLLLPLLALACGGMPSTPGTAPPIAQAGQNQAVTAGAPVTLDGSGSTDPAGLTLSYAWTQVSGPAVTLTSPSSALATFTAPAMRAGEPPATLGFALAVSDPGGSTAVATNTQRPAGAPGGAPRGPGG